VTRFDAIGGRGEWLADYLTYTRHDEFAVARMRALDTTTLHGLTSHAQSRASANATVPAGGRAAGDPAAARGQPSASAGSTCRPSAPRAIERTASAAAIGSGA
jgi:hypothetical protein